MPGFELENFVINGAEWGPRCIIRGPLELGVMAGKFSALRVTRAYETSQDAAPHGPTAPQES